MSKGTTDFWAPLMGIDIATKPRNGVRHLDWDRVRELIEVYKDAHRITVGLREDWNNTAGAVYEDGKYVEPWVLYTESYWATPICDIDGVEYDCWKYGVQEFNPSDIPNWLKEAAGENKSYWMYGCEEDED